MHGLALTMLTSKQARHYIAKTSKKKPIELELIERRDNMHWHKTESLT